MAPLDRDGNVRSAEFSPDGKRIATAGDNGIQIWDAQSGQPLTEPLNCPGMSAAFSPDGKRILTASGNVCDVSPVQQKLPDWLFELTEAVSGQLLNKRGVLEETKLNRAETIKEIREKLSQDSSGNDWSLLGRWFLADPATRTISPFSKVTVPQYIEDRIKEGTAESLDEAQRLAGGNTNLLQRIFQARTTLKPTKPE
jgi:hypothetical protein